MGLLKPIIIKLIKAKWGAILPMLLRAIAEGQAGPAAKKVYWVLAEKKTFVGALFLAVGAGFEQLAASFPEQFPWAAGAAQALYVLGGILASVGLIDGGTRAPWPQGTPKDPELPNPVVKPKPV